MERRSFLSKLGIALGITAVPLSVLESLEQDKIKVVVTPFTEEVELDGKISDSANIYFHPTGLSFCAVNPDGSIHDFKLGAAWDVSTAIRVNGVNDYIELNPSSLSI